MLKKLQKKIFSLFLIAFIAFLSFGSVSISLNTNNQQFEINNLTAFAAPGTPGGATQKDFIPKPTTLPGPSVEDQLNSGGTRKTLVTQTLPKFIVALIGFVGIGSLVFLVISGIRFATAYGNEESVEKAKNQAMYAVVGFVIALLSYTIVAIISNINLESVNQNSGAATSTGQNFDLDTTKYLT